MNIQPIPSVNYHLIRPCNMSCKYCFATFSDSKKDFPKGMLSKTESFQLIDKLVKTGFQKITFAGGEPTLVKWLPDLIRRAKAGGLTTMIVSNGSMLTKEYLAGLKGALDWVTISVDSIVAATNKQIGRQSNRLLPDEQYYQALVDRIRNAGFRLKINTVVSRQNYKELLGDFIKKAKPERWKIFQVLPMKGQNDQHIDKMTITDDEFQNFLEKHEHVQESGVTLVPENNYVMKGSYVMIDPAGRFFDNIDGRLKYSEEILEVGVKRALSMVRVNVEKFLGRDGIYNWD
jgi:radical S-adenosyl methionine domain-containing protein 2